MRQSIVLVGDDTALNRARLSLLRPRYDVTVIGVEDFFQQLHLKGDLLLVCHSIPIDASASIIEIAAEMRPAWRILWLAEWHTVPGLIVSGHSVIQIDTRKQAWLVEVEKVLHAMKASAQSVPKTPVAHARAVRRAYR